MQSGQLRIQVASKTALITPLMVVLFHGVFRGFGDFILAQVRILSFFLVESNYWNKIAIY